MSYLVDKGREGPELRHLEYVQAAFQDRNMVGRHCFGKRMDTALSPDLNANTHGRVCAQSVCLGTRL